MEVAKADAFTRLLLLGALAVLEEGPAAEVCLGLPVALFASEQQRLSSLIKGRHEVALNGETRPLAVRGMLVPEGFGLLINAAQTEAGLPDFARLQASTVVLDFGHRTTQLLAFRGLRMSPLAFSLPRGRRRSSRPS